MFTRAATLVPMLLPVLILLVSCGKKESAPTGESQNLPRNTTAARCFLDNIGSVLYPDTQKSIQVSGVNGVAFGGWGIDEPNKSVAAGIDVVVDQVPYTAKYGIERPDVAGFFKNPAYLHCGFQYMMPAGKLPKGSHTVSLRVISKDKKTYYQGQAFVFTVN